VNVPHCMKVGNNNRPRASTGSLQSECIDRATLQSLPLPPADLQQQQQKNNIGPNPDFVIWVTQINCTFRVRFTVIYESVAASIAWLRDSDGMEEVKNEFDDV
jgi:hypothetical protein